MPAVRLSPLLSEPCLVLAVYTLFSGAGVYSQLTASKEGQQAAEQASKLLQLATSGNDIDAAYAKRLAFATLEAVLQTQLGVFFAANLAAGCYAGFTLVTKTLFVGQLTATETSQLAERLLKFAMVKVAFLAVIQSPDYGSVMQWLAWCAVVCWLSMFTKLASLRADALLSSPSATLAQHLRILLLLGGILAQDLSWVAGFLRTARNMQGGSLSHALLWLFDAAFVAVDASYAIVKYAVQAADYYQATRAEACGEEREPWESRRSELVYWLDLAADFTLHTLNLLHYMHLWWLHGLQLQLIDGVLFLDVRLLLGALRRRLQHHQSYRRLQHQLHHSFADAPTQQLADNPCCICLSSMKAGKLLPCGHVMHASCLCAWIQENTNGSCPLCRAKLDIQSQPQQPPMPVIRQQRHNATAASGKLRQHGSSERQQRAKGSSEAGSTSSPANPGRTPGNATSPVRTRPFTRLQARLAASAAAQPLIDSGGNSGAVTQSPSMHRRRVDGIVV